MADYDYLIVGAGFAGAVLAERLSSQLRKTCLVVDRRHHIAGNAYDYHNDAGLLVHKYGPHYFRTNSDQVIDYLSQFTEWLPMHYRILSWTHGQYWPFPINLNTFERLIGRDSTPEEMEATLNEWRHDIPSPKNSKEVVLSQVGTRLYEMFFENYTRKHWKRDPSELDPSVCGRIPVRTNRDDRYLSDKFQAMPKKGYTAMFEKMLAQPGITLSLGVDYQEVRNQVNYQHLIYTGMIDEYFNFQHGDLPYRSLRFAPETHDIEFYQPAVQVNYPNDHDFTRIVEIKHVTGQTHDKTTIVKEFPEDYHRGKEAYYPVPAPDARERYQKYRQLAEKEKGTLFVGRLATYRYYNMDQVVATALKTFTALSTASATSSPDLLGDLT
ncbi:MAG: UDP-galactopyranose mutase [Verrucomicrobiales bacterium]|jgi:UDP-galactopyranose mutase